VTGGSCYAPSLRRPGVRRTLRGRRRRTPSITRHRQRRGRGRACAATHDWTSSRDSREERSNNCNKQEQEETFVLIVFFVFYKKDRTIAPKGRPSTPAWIWRNHGPISTAAPAHRQSPRDPCEFSSLLSYSLCGHGSASAAMSRGWVPGANDFALDKGKLMFL